MAYEHTVKATEMATSVSTPRQVDSSIPLFIGCSPINMTGDLTNVNKINLYMDQQSAVLGEGLVLPEGGKFKFSNSEAIYAAFTLMAVAPIMVVNVLDPAKHKTSVTGETVTIVDGVGVLLNSGVLKDTVVVTDAELNTDYVLTWTNRGLLQINKTDSSKLTDSITVAYDYLDPTKVTSNDIIGGIDSATGANTGLELINSAYTETGLMVGQLVAAGFSGTSEVAASMTTKADSINGVFSCMSLHDLPTDTIRKHTDAQAYKKANNIVNENQIALWPKTSLGGTQYNASIIQAVVTMATDADYNGIPYKSPSNEYAPMDSAVLEDGTIVSLTMDNTAYLNGQGICTFLNLDGWKTRGNNTAAYPANTDVKDRFISVKRMFKWIANTAILTDWKNLDAPINQRLIDTIQDSNNLWLNTLSGQEALVGSQNRVEVLASENQLTDTLNGKITYHWYITPPTPAEVIHHVIEYDVNNLAELFNGGAS
jgi:uncharacterized protein